MPISNAAKSALNVLQDLETEEAPAAKSTAAQKALSVLDELDQQPTQGPADMARGTGVVTDPLAPPSARTVADPSAIGGLEAGIVSDVFVDQEPPDIARKAASAGVDYATPAPVGHALASLGVNDEERRKAYEQSLTEHFGKPVRVEMGPSTGALEYLNPETGRFTLVEPPDQGMLNDIAGAAGGSIVMVPELAGGALAAFATKSPWAVNMAGGAGAVVGEAARAYLGQALGINQDVTDTEILARAGIEGGKSAAAGIVAEKALQAVQFIRSAFKGEAVSFAGKNGDRLGVSLEDAAKIQDQINEALAAERMRIGARNADLPAHLRTPDPENRRFNLTLGEGSGDPDLLIRQDAIKRSPTFQAEFGEFDQERQQTLVDFYDLLGKPFERSTLSPSQTADRVREMGRTKLDYEQRRAGEHMARYQADAAEALGNVATMPLHQLGDVARRVGDAEYGAFQGRAEALANQIRTVAGEARFIENKELAAAFSELDARSRNIFLGALRRDTRKQQMIPPKTLEGPEGEAVLNPVFDPNTKWSFSQAWDTLSRLKQVIRDGGQSDIDIGALKKMAGAIETDLYESANKSELGEIYRNFTGWYRREKTRLNQGTVGTILQREGGPGGRFTMASEEVFREVFPATNARGGGGITATREFLDLIKNDPQAVGAFRQAIADDWRAYVTRDGRVNPARHQEWLNMHREQLGLKIPGLSGEARRALASFDIQSPENAGEALFTSQELKSINTAAGFEKALQAREASTQQALEAINKRFSAKLSNLEDPGQLMNLVRKDLDGNNARELMKVLEKTPDVRRGFQAAYLKDMRERVMGARHPTTQESILSPRGLRTFLYGKADESQRGQLEVMRSLFGDDYVKGITTLESALSMTAREAPFPNRSNTSFWWNVGVRVAQAKFGVISRPARIATAASRISRASADALMARAIMNPSNMKRLMSVWNKDIRDRKTVAILSQLGLGAGDLSPQED